MKSMELYVVVLILCSVICEGRHLNMLNTGTSQGRQQNMGNGRLVSSPFIANRRSRKVMSKTFQNMLNNKPAPNNEGNEPNHMSSHNAVNSRTVSSPNVRNMQNANHVRSMQNGNHQMSMGRQGLSNFQNANRKMHNNNALSRMNKHGNQMIRKPMGVSNLGNTVKNLPNTFPRPSQGRTNIQKNKVPFPSLINQRVNSVGKQHNTKSNVPIITMVPKAQLKSKIVQKLMERKRQTMLQKMKALPSVTYRTLQPVTSNAVTNTKLTSTQEISAALDSTNQIKVISKNNTAEVKIINTKPRSASTGDPNIIVLKDISITNTSVEGVNGTVNDTKMSITLMSEATGGRPLVIEANSNIVVSQEKMPNGTVQFIIRTDTMTTTLPPTTTSVAPAEEGEIEGEETTTTAPPSTTAEA